MPTKETKKTTAPKKAGVKKETKKTAPVAKGKYKEAIGRRKTAIARVRFYTGEKKETKSFDIEVNGKKFTEFFPLPRQQKNVLAAFVATGENYPVTVQVKGGGIMAQAEAVRLGASRILVSMNEDYRGKLKQLGYLTRDPRMVERKKFGSRKARRPQQWRKR